MRAKSKDKRAGARVTPSGVHSHDTRASVARDAHDAVDIFTDGACSGNPGPGGWGAVLRWRGHARELFGADPQTTNNRMELMAAIAALESLKRGARVRLHTDSLYLKDGITRWIRRWRANGWRTASRKPVKNEDLWRRLSSALARHEVDWLWVKGHAGHPDNERADALARQGVAQVLAATNGSDGTGADGG